MAKPLIATVVLNTNRREDTLDCLRSLERSSYSHRHDIVLDNNSTDGSVQAIRAEFPRVEIVLLQENRGYAGNNNVGISTALARGADWVFVLNEDTVLAPDCLEEMVRAAERGSRTGVVGPMVYHHDEPQVIQSAGGVLDSRWRSRHRRQNETDGGEQTDPVAVDCVSGCAILVRRPLIEQVGMLDERFFYYWEETEWCLRGVRAGWAVLLVPRAKLWHKGVNRDYRPGPSVTYYNTRNRLLMMSKHRAPLTARAWAWTEVGRTLASWSLRPRWRTERAHRDAMWLGCRDYLRGHWGRMPEACRKSPPTFA
jgi:GT2 family glycosyltransferase